jgi:hypothetical protein
MWDHHGRIFRALAFVDGRGVGQYQCVEFAKPVADGAAVEASGEVGEDRFDPLLYYIRYLFRIVACLGDDEKCMFLHSRSSAPRCQGLGVSFPGEGESLPSTLTARSARRSSPVGAFCLNQPRRFGEPRPSSKPMGGTGAGIRYSPRCRSGGEGHSNLSATIRFVLQPSSRTTPWALSGCLGYVVEDGVTVARYDALRSIHGPIRLRSR